jgi:hypothetical protein
MAEWFKRSTVNTFYRGSSPLKALHYIILYNFKNIIKKNFLIKRSNFFKKGAAVQGLFIFSF